VRGGYAKVSEEQGFFAFLYEKHDKMALIALPILVNIYITESIILFTIGNAEVCSSRGISF
jgi:hypothetical protein